MRGDVPACLAWAAAYQLIGVLGGSLFAEPWQGVALAVGLTLVIAAGPTVRRRLHRTPKASGRSRGRGGRADAPRTAAAPAVREAGDAPDA